MAKAPNLIFMLVSFYTLTYQVHQTRQYSWDSTFQNRTIDLCFSVRRNQTGHYITKWLVNKESSELPNNMKIDVKSSMTEYKGVQSFQLQGVISVPPPKPASYELFPGIGYYKFYPDGALTYYQASTTCASEGGHLAIVNSEAEANVIKILYARFPAAKEWAYLGFNDLATEGKYVTIFGQPLDSTGYMLWHPGQPDNSEGNEDCGSIHRTGKLNDLWCESKGPWPFICEYDLAWEEI